MISTITKAAAGITASVVLASPAIAGPYANVETNAGFTGSDYGSSVTDLHVGWEGEAGVTSYYIQGGPALVNVDGEDETDTELSGKVGLSVAATDQLDVYGELSMLTDGDNDNNYGVKAGVKFAF